MIRLIKAHPDARLRVGQMIRIGGYACVVIARFGNRRGIAKVSHKL